MAATEIVRFHMDADKKERCTKMYDSRGITISEAIRCFLDKELAAYENPVAVLDTVASNAQLKIDTAKTDEPTIEDLVAYVDAVRAERLGQTMTIS